MSGSRISPECGRIVCQTRVLVKRGYCNHLILARVEDILYATMNETFAIPIPASKCPTADRASDQSRESSNEKTPEEFPLPESEIRWISFVTVQRKPLG